MSTSHEVGLGAMSDTAGTGGVHERERAHADPVVDADAALRLLERAVARRGGTGARTVPYTDIAREALALLRPDGEDRPVAARQRDFRVLYFCGGTRVSLTAGAAAAFRAARRADLLRSAGEVILADATHAVRRVWRRTAGRT